MLSGVHSPGREHMKAIRFKTGFAIFVIFFGLAALQAIGDGNWWLVTFWVIIGTTFLIADNLRKHKEI